MKKSKRVMFINNERMAILFFILLSLSIILVLFRGGNVLGGGEVGATFYSPLRIFEMLRYAWSDVYLGITSGLTSASTPTFGLLGLFEKIGIAPTLIQAVFFFLMLLLTLLSMFYFAKKALSSQGVFAWLITALFYLFNPYAVFNVWNRFLPNTMLFYAFMPLGLLVFNKGLQEKKYRFVFLLSILSALASYAFSAPAQTLIYWGLLGITAIFYYMRSNKKSFVIKYLLLFIIVWLITNFWWVSQQLSFSGSSAYTTTTQQFFTNVGNINTFVSLSTSLGQLRDIFLFRHGRIVHETNNYPFNWPHLYATPSYEIFAWFSIIITFYFVIKNIKKPFLSFLLTIFTLGIFFSKGNLPPFGILFYRAFEKLFLLQFFRNPFEKIGFISTFSFSLLFGYGVSEAVLSLRSRNLKKILVINILILLVILNGLPFFTGLVFTGDLFPSNNLGVGIEVKIPDDYKKLNNFLQDKCEDCRYIALPLGLGEGIYYNWPRGYVGLEQTGFLLKNPGISHNTTLPYYGILSSQIEPLFFTYEHFDKVAYLLNAPFIIVRKDIDFKRSRMRNPEVIETLINKRESENDVFSFLKTFGNLSIYGYDKSDNFSKIYSASNFSVTTDTSAYDQIFLTNFKEKEVLYPYGSINSLEAFLNSYTPSIVIKSDVLFESFQNNFLKYSEEPYIFPYVNILPNSRFYPLILLKERINGIFKSDIRDKIYWDLLLLGKRLKETQGSVELEDYSAAHVSLAHYNKNLPHVFDSLSYLNKNLRNSDERIWDETEIVKLFSSHLYVLKQLETSNLNDDGSITETINRLRTFSSNTDVLPFWDLVQSDNFPGNDRVIYRVSVPKLARYEILLPKTEFFPNDFTTSGELAVQIDEITEMRKYMLKNDYISLGYYDFEKGVHEISLNQNTQTNLVESKDYIVEASIGLASIEIPIKKYSPFNNYRISFDYNINYGGSLNFIIENDNDFIEDNKGYYFHKVLQPDNYFFGTRNYTTDFISYPLSSSAKLIFQVMPWNNCLSIYSRNKNKCDDFAVFNSYSKPTKVTIKNLTVTPKLPKSLYLRQESNDQLRTPTSIIYTKENPTTYLVSVRGANGPFLLVFSEAYDSRWKLYGSNDEPYDEKLHELVNGYANAWWVDKTGDFELTINYSSQKILTEGYIISAVSIIGCIAILIFTRLKARLNV